MTAKRRHTLARLADRDPRACAEKLSDLQAGLLLSLYMRDPSVFDEFPASRERTRASLVRAELVEGLRPTPLGILVAEELRPLPWTVDPWYPLPKGTCHWGLWRPGTAVSKGPPDAVFVARDLAETTAELLARRDLQRALERGR